MPDGKHLIMGFFAGHSFRILERFVASLHRIAFGGDVCLFVDDVSAETVDALREHAIQVERLGRSSQPRMTAMSSRYFSYLDFLARHGDAYTRILLLDPSSAVLQSDPFATPLPVDILYTRERCLLVDSPDTWNAVVRAYGEAVAANLRDCTVSCADVSIGTANGMLRYLVAMTHELSSRTVPIGGNIDQGIHNYVARMRPLRNAWVDTTDSVVAALRSVPGAAIGITDRGVTIDGRLTPVLHQWEQNTEVRAYVTAAARFRLDVPPAALRGQPSADAVLAYYHRPRDADWLALFLASLRCAGHSGPLHCIGEFNDTELQLVARHGGIAHPVAASDPAIVENFAHLCLGQLVERMAADASVQHDQILVLDSVRVAFLRDPFENKTIGLSAFCEGPTRIGESGYNMQRLASFPPTDDSWLRRPIVSSSLLRGPLPVMQTFYRKLLAELVGRAELLRTHKVIQGAVNKLCHGGKLGASVTLHPNAAEAFLEVWPSHLALDTRLGIRLGGAVPAMVVNHSGVSQLIMSAAASLGLPPPGI
jgi:hypothetical protein